MGYVVEVTIPIRLVSEANAHTHWRVRQKRAKEQRRLATLTCYRPLLNVGRLNFRHVPIVVTMTRIAPCALDSDNAVGSAKHIRDGVADALDVNDNDPRIEWVVRQEKGAPNEYAVRIKIETIEPRGTT